MDPMGTAYLREKPTPQKIAENKVQETLHFTVRNFWWNCVPDFSTDYTWRIIPGLVSG